MMSDRFDAADAVAHRACAADQEDERERWNALILEGEGAEGEGAPEAPGHKK